MPTSVTQYGITWTFDADYPVGQFANGDWYVVAQSGLSIVNITPFPSKDPVTGRDINGSMVNPVAGVGARQGFDSSSACPYLLAFNAARPGGNDLSALNPMVVATNSSVVSSISRSGARVRPQLSDAAVLTVLPTAPAANAFRPPYCGTDKTIPGTHASIRWDRVPSLAATPNYDASQLTSASLSRPWIEIATEFEGREIHPSNNQPDYGRDMARVLGRLALHALGPATQEQKLATVTKLIQYGLDVYGAAVTGGNWRANGGHNMGRIMPLLLASHWLNLPQIADYANVALFNRFQEYQQAFYVEQIDVDITNGPTWDPDTRATLIPYDVSMIGLPEWGLRNTVDKRRNNASWNATYRGINNQEWPAHGLVLQILGLKAACNYPAYFDYCDRIFLIDDPSPTASSSIGQLTSQMWRAYRTLGAPVWTPSSGGGGGGPTIEPITITGQPQSVATTVGQGWQFAVSATGTAPITYQWRRNGTSVPGATASTLAGTSALLGDAGSYDCVITNPAGSVTSAAATLNVAAAPVPPSTVQFRKAKLPKRL